MFVLSKEFLKNIVLEAASKSLYSFEQAILQGRIFNACSDTEFCGRVVAYLCVNGSVFGEQLGAVIAVHLRAGSERHGVQHKRRRQGCGRTAQSPYQRSLQSIKRERPPKSTEPIVLSLVRSGIVLSCIFEKIKPKTLITISADAKVLPKQIISENI